ncbi:hypothetical protein SGPA1_40336 [Streptomyces misionensis JCM 4497]
MDTAASSIPRAPHRPDSRRPPVTSATTTPSVPVGSSGAPAGRRPAGRCSRRSPSRLRTPRRRPSTPPAPSRRPWATRTVGGSDGRGAWPVAEPCDWRSAHGARSSTRVRCEDGPVERSAVRGGVPHGVVDGVQAERTDPFGAKVERARRDEPDHADVRRARVHPLAADGDRVPHEPRVGEGEVLAAEHADAAHEDDSALFAHGHGRGAGHRTGRGGREGVEHHVDGAVGGRGHRGPVGGFVPGQFDGPDTWAEPVGEKAEDGTVAARRDHPAGPHGQRQRHRRTAEIAGGPTDEERLAGFEPARQQPPVGDGVHAEQGPAGRIVPGLGRQRMDVLRGHAHPFRERPVVQIPGEPRTALAAGTPALEHDVGRQRVVAGTHGAVAPHEVADPQPGGVRTDVHDPSHPSQTGYLRRFERIVPPTAEDILRIRRDKGRQDLDHHFPTARFRLGHLPHAERGSEPCQDRCSHPLTSLIVCPEARSTTGMRQAKIPHM